MQFATRNLMLCVGAALGSYDISRSRSGPPAESAHACCSAQNVADSVATRPVTTQDAVVAFLQNVSAIQAPMRTVIRDKPSWDRFWSHATAAGQHLPAVMATPVVDFSHDMVVAVSEGLKPAGTYVSIAHIESDGRSLTVHILLRTHVPPACMTDGGYAPLAIVEIARSNLPVTFVQAEERMNCAADRN